MFKQKNTGQAYFLLALGKVQDKPCNFDTSCINKQTLENI